MIDNYSLVRGFGCASRSARSKGRLRFNSQAEPPLAHFFNKVVEGGLPVLLFQSGNGREFLHFFCDHVRKNNNLGATGHHRLLIGVMLR